MDRNFDDVSKTSFFIPHKSPSKNNRPHSRLPSSPFPDRELKGGNELRFTAYHVAWKKCLDRIQEIIRNLQKSTVDAVVMEVRSSNTVDFPGLPYPELPVIAIINPAFGSSLIAQISTNLEVMDELDANSACLVTHLHPEDFPTVSAGMKAIVSNFIDKEDGKERVKRKPTSSLAGYDIRRLEAWYKYRALSDCVGPHPKLVIILHDVEQCDSSVIQNILYVCSGASPNLPFVFLLSLSSPTSNYLTATYSQLFLSPLRIRTITAPFGRKILQEFWLKTFFNIDFEPDVMIGPVILEALQDYFNRYNTSVDTIVTLLQLAHLKHFSSDPLTLLVHETPSGNLAQPDSHLFLGSLRARLDGKTDTMEIDVTGSQSSVAVVAAVDTAREQFYGKARDLRLGFGMILRIQEELKSHGYKGLDWSLDEDKDNGLCAAMLDALRGRLGRDVKHLGIFVKKMKVAELRSTLDILNLYFFNMPSHVRTQEQEARTQIILLRSRISDLGDDDADPPTEIASIFSDWLVKYLREKLTLLEEVDLWDIWYTGNSPPVSEVLNPSIKASVIAGLLRPHAYSKDISLDSPGNSPYMALRELPDTGILFKRYLDSGKMINVFDWFESFKSVLETQKMHQIASNTVSAPSGSSPRKKGRKQKKVAVMTEEDEGEWKIEVQARFIRSLHELDYLGFIKTTGRKADHVLRTVFDVGDDDNDSE